MDNFRIKHKSSFSDYHKCYHIEQGDHPLEVAMICPSFFHNAKQESRFPHFSLER